MTKIADRQTNLLAWPEASDLARRQGMSFHEHDGRRYTFADDANRVVVILDPGPGEQHVMVLPKRGFGRATVSADDVIARVPHKGTLRDVLDVYLALRGER